MGANVSDLQSAVPQSAHIISFHSTAEWKAHFDASQQTDKLVSYIYIYIYPIINISIIFGFFTEIKIFLC